MGLQAISSCVKEWEPESSGQTSPQISWLVHRQLAWNHQACTQLLGGGLTLPLPPHPPATRLALGPKTVQSQYLSITLLLHTVPRLSQLPAPTLALTSRYRMESSFLWPLMHLAHASALLFLHLGHYCHYSHDSPTRLLKGKGLCPVSQLLFWYLGHCGCLLFVVRKKESLKNYSSFKTMASSFSSVQSLSCIQLFATSWTTARQASLSITNSWSPPKPMSIKSVMLSNHLILCRPLLLLPSIFPSIRVFSNKSALHIRWPKYWSFSFNISPSNEHPGLISFRMNWLDLLAIQGTLKNLLQHHSSKASLLLCSAFFIVQLSHPYMTTGKTIALTRQDLCWQSNVSAF